ncbi:MAG: hypothetical protein JWN89_773 [Parcubacteria group bacterium]|nr:hypothetical protein [Parcubacteria group bacterium]
MTHAELIKVKTAAYSVVILPTAFAGAWYAFHHRHFWITAILVSVILLDAFVLWGTFTTALAPKKAPQPKKTWKLPALPTFLTGSEQSLQSESRLQPIGDI